MGLFRTLQHDWVSYVLGTVKFYFVIFKGLIILNFELKYVINGKDSNCKKDVQYILMPNDL
jgi:hypothetical protein